MIKKSLLGLFVGCLCLCGSVFGMRDTITVYQNGSYIDSPSDSQLKFFVSSHAMLSSQRLGVTRRMIALTSVDNNRAYFWWHDGIPYFYYYFASDNVFFQGHAVKYKICDPLSMGDTIYRNCSDESISNLSFVEEVKPFFDAVTSSDLFGISNEGYRIGVGYPTVYNIHVCFSSQSYGKSVCFITEDGLDNSLGLSENLTMGDISQIYFGDPPGWSTSGGSGGNYENDNGGIAPGSDYSALNYYEKTYGRDSSICYAGIDNLTSVYGQNSVSFHEGRGLSIFQVFSGLYNGDQDLSHMYVWLNSLLGNYELWYAIGSPTLTEVGNPPYLLNYNSGTYQVDVYYDNLTFPFSGKPVALYFIASNIEDHSIYNTMGASVVSYCNLKINGGSYDDIVSEADKNNITNYTEQYNTNQGLNSDGSTIEHDGYFGSGVTIGFTGDTSIKNTLKEFFEDFDYMLGVLDINTNNRILPTWLVSAFIFVVLFKFLRKR